MDPRRARRAEWRVLCIITKRRSGSQLTTLGLTDLRTNTAISKRHDAARCESSVLRSRRKIRDKRDGTVLSPTLRCDAIGEYSEKILRAAEKIAGINYMESEERAQERDTHAKQETER